MRGPRVVPNLLLLLLGLPLALPAQTVAHNDLDLAPFVVTGKRPSAADTATQDMVRTYDENEIEGSGAATLDDFLENLPRDGSGNRELVLIDGMPGGLDPALLTPAMIEGIDVSNTGAMPSVGVFINGRVINIRLKQNYEGRSLNLDTTVSLHGDGWRHSAMLTGGAFEGKWKVVYTLRYNHGTAVTADARDFSRGQDNRARGGRDFRLPWGDIAVVQAVAGNLTGVVNAAGQPVATALVPEGAMATPAPGGFLPGTSPVASGQRFFNTAPYLYLMTRRTGRRRR